MTKMTASDPGESNDLLLHAYFDGELDAANALAVKARIDSDRRSATKLANVAALQTVLRARFPREPVPARLRARVNATIGVGRGLRRPTWTAMAASILVAMMLSSGSTWFALQAPRDDQAIGEVVDSHLRALMSQRPIDVASSERHTVKPWFNGRIPESPRVLDLSAEGFPLIGGRIDVIKSRPVPTLVYGRRLHVISLTAAPSPRGGTSATTPRAAHGYNVVSWSGDGITYWAVSDLNERELEEFSRLFRSKPG
jgi:anti-sigma factor RsiW